MRYKLIVEVHGLASPRIATDARRTLLHAERTEATNLHVLIVTQCLDNRLEKSINNGLGLELREPRTLSNAIDNV